MTEDPKKTESMLTHEPLPYIIVLKATLGDDAVPVTSEWRGYGYSLLEAMMSAMSEVTGVAGQDESKVRIVSAVPDIAAWLRMPRRAL